MVAVLEAILGLFLISLVTKLFLTRTLIGRTVLFILKDIYYLFKLSVKIIDYTIRHGYKLSKKGYEFLKKQYERFCDEKNGKNSKQDRTKKVVNGNIVNIKDYQRRK